MSYSKFKIDKNFWLGFSVMALALCLPIISEPFISLTTTIRDKISGVVNN